MTGEIIYAPPIVPFDPHLALELERWVRADVPQDVPPLLSPFDGYTRSLTERGGFRVTYIDQVSNLFLDALRGFPWTMATGIAIYALIKTPLPGILTFVLSVAIACGNLWLVTRKWKVKHSIEIHPNGMIIDDKHVFSIEDIGDNSPELQLIDDDSNRMVLSGIVGTRFIEQFATGNRLDEWDRTPEVLAADLELAMEQLWGRREARALLRSRDVAQHC